MLHWQSMFGDPSNTWADLGWVREHWDGPIALKGVLHPDDARRAVDAGVEARPGVQPRRPPDRWRDRLARCACRRWWPRSAGSVEVLLDSGVRTGSDVLKALALGAQAVLIGRPYVYGLGLGGEDGVRHVLRSLLAELDLTMALAGCASLADVGPELLTHIP